MFFLLALLKYWLFALFALVQRPLSGLEREDALGTRLHPFATFSCVFHKSAYDPFDWRSIPSNSNLLDKERLSTSQGSF